MMVPTRQLLRSIDADVCVAPQLEPRAMAELAALGFAVFPSAANSVFARQPRRDAGELAAALRSRSIIVRHFRQPRIEQFLRITVGTDAQCQALISALREIFG